MRSRNGSSRSRAKRSRRTQGSLYPALHRLEQKRWLKSAWRQSETGREAKFYRSRAPAEKQLAAEKETWDRLAAAVQLIFDEGS